MKLSKDIYGLAVRLDRAIIKLDKSSISQRNKDLINEFNRASFIEGLSKSRRTKIIGRLRIIAEDYLKKDFDKATKDELKDVFMRIDGREDYSPWTKRGYKVITRKFYKWLKFGDEYRTRTDYPPIISWLRCTVSRKEQPRVKASDLLTEDEVKLLIDTAEHARDKAFIAMIYELGARIGEIGGLLIKELTRDKFGYIVDLEGKTGHRTPRIVNSDQYVTTWLNVHPFRDKPEAPLWVMIGNRNKGKRMQYAAFRALVKRLVINAGIKKRIYPHLFRHTRVTHLLADKQINEAQAKVYFGWVPQSRMLSEYSHLMSSDVNNAILAMHGIKTGKEKQSPLKAKQCPKCEGVSSGTAKFCQKCGSILDVKTAIELEEKRSKSDDILDQLMEEPDIRKAIVKKLVNMGLKEKTLSVK